MNRRHVIKTLALASGSLIILPSWMGRGSSTNPATYRSSFSHADGELLAAVVDTIIPAGKSVGALTVGVDKFLQKLFDECYEADVQDNIKSGLKKLDLLSNEKFGKSYVAAGQTERQQLLLQFASSNDKSQNDFFTLMKSETIRGFTTSQEVMEKYLHYEVAPGHYYGCVSINTSNARHQ
jgi:hypothetical protein